MIGSCNLNHNSAVSSLNINIETSVTRMDEMIAKLVGMDDESLQEAAKLILAGRLIAYPTDTVYGLGCNPFDKDAVERLIQAKQRSKGSLPVLVNSMRTARRFGEFNKAALMLAGQFWPGPLTMVVPSRESLPKPVTDDSQWVGLRIPKHETTLNLLEKCGGQIIGTSANVSGHVSPRTADQVLSELGGRIDLIIDGGATPLGRESTVAKIIGSMVDVVREGAISREEILKALKVG
jgi:L-threonylcarbamoyladenylate synthase